MVTAAMLGRLVNDVPVAKALRRALLGAGAALLLSAPAAGAATVITVDTVADPTPDGAAPCSFREAIIVANDDADSNGCVRDDDGGPGGDEIVFSDTAFPPGAPAETINLTGAAPEISSDVRITADGGPNVIIDGDSTGDHGVLVISAGTVEIEHLDFVGGKAPLIGENSWEVGSPSAEVT